MNDVAAILSRWDDPRWLSQHSISEEVRADVLALAIEIGTLRARCERLADFECEDCGHSIFDCPCEDEFEEAWDDADEPCRPP